MIINVKGIVLNSIKYGDFDKLITILSDQGKFFFKARGIRSVTSKNAAGCNKFCFSEFILEKRGDKAYLRKALPIYQTVRNGCDIEELALASYFAEMCEDTALDSETGAKALKLLINALYILSKNDRPLELIKAVFEIRMLALNGFIPLFESCSICGRDNIIAGRSYFDLTNGNFTCPECHNDKSGNEIMISESVIELMKRSISLGDDEAYALKLPNDILSEFGRVCENFSTFQYDKKYKTLDFYKELKKLPK